ncbi:hypothetical protein JCGZ_15827 [Jatropha curcas]|uniref:Uncharacterized protein n=1 Tax=Jatropha curcas TaxID=180498 RepID=A0A067LA86_JATCU|nr:uncharacterized protein LOC105630650 [Jatropha curcas]KDP41420.1 hypothetical protein JCGZ_15827 [Jatropha curcas]
MGYLKRSKQEATATKSKPDGKCKKHPKHKQSPGVCSVCLNEKLSMLSSSSSRTAVMDYASSSSASSLSAYSTTSCSSCSSPMHRFRFTTEGNNHKGSLSFLLISGKNVLTKSRSLAFVPRNRGNKERASHDDDKKKGGFFSKLLRRPRTNKRAEQGLMHSRSMRERVMSISRVN